MADNAQPNSEKPEYDADMYSQNVAGCFPPILKLLAYYDMTFDYALCDEYGNENQSPRGTRQFLDVGSGCGQVTLKALLPSVPEDVGKIVGVDACANMVSYARQHSSHPRILYEQLDITGDVSGFLASYGPFDRIYSFNCLNRVREQPKAWSNVAKLLKPGGDCLLFYAAHCVTPDIWRALAKKKRWSRFAERWEQLITPTQDMRSTEERLNYVKSLAKEVGLELRSCEMAANYIPVQDRSGMLTALIPGNTTLTAEERQLLFQDANEEFQNWLQARPRPRLADNYVIHAIKPMKQQL
ncbi:hypothetical protein HPB50_009576 [Hyalomma asiaticum]|uniref:Uncharacterized protein n=1 Tax=Hyalomma asiaticum TaxID=266040 RepID=A0ACB7RPY8_HYAAI|nr:hypothetical protein HPB50_009576 [Hyalomma asiaticum]